VSNKKTVYMSKKRVSYKKTVYMSKTAGVL
jgi:hypothetical protein